MNYEEIPNNQELEANDTRPIGELLSRYYETHGTNPTYEIERSIPIDGHEVAWLKYEGNVIYDVTARGQEGKKFEGHTLACACKFTEGVGFEMDEQGRLITYKDSCFKKDAAIRLRHLELQQEYKQRGMLSELDWLDEHKLVESAKAVMLDLITKRKANEFIEGTSGASFYGGHYYLQTVGEITNLPMESITKATHELVANKLISLHESIVQDYREPYKAQTYEPQSAPEAILHYEKPDKVWALVPRPEEKELDLQNLTIDDSNRVRILGSCIIGLAHTEELAKARLHAAITQPRQSNERLYQLSLVEPSYHAGALAVIAYTARRSDQQEEWLVEGFVGDAIEPEVHSLAMDHPTMFGIDIADMTHINDMVDQWYPPKHS